LLGRLAVCAHTVALICSFAIDVDTRFHFCCLSKQIKNLKISLWEVREYGNEIEHSNTCFAFMSFCLLEFKKIAFLQFFRS